jgi:hypothetical protein
MPNCPNCGEDLTGLSYHDCAIKPSQVSVSFNFGGGKVKPKGWLKYLLSFFKGRKNDG